MNKRLKQAIQSHKDDRASVRGKRYDDAHFPNIRKGDTLSKEEKMMIKEKWDGVTPAPLDRGYNFYLGIKSIGEFNPDYLPSAYYNPYVWRMLNHKMHYNRLSHKAMTQTLYSRGIKHPVTLIRSYGGVLLGSDYQPLTIKEAVALLKKQENDILYKLAIDSCKGIGVKLIRTGEIPDFCQTLIDGSVLDSGDFVVQQMVSQSEVTKIFNPTSLNCFRITTFKVNDEISVGGRGLKCGPVGSVVDNIGAGKQGVMVGVAPDGTIAERGFYGNGEIATEHGGIPFCGRKIEHFNRVLDAAIELHKYVDSCKIIGWDIALDADDQPVLIEGNTEYPGILVSQMCGGPIFGERTDEVISWLRRHPYL